jgi:hypothetical protein
MAKLEAKARLVLSAYTDFEDAQALALQLFFCICSKVQDLTNT